MSAAGSSLALRRRWADLIASGYDRLVASDPGLARLRLALGVLVSVALAVLVLGLAGFAITGVLLGASIAMVTSSGPVQRTVRRQAAVIGLTIVPAAGALTLSALLGGHRVVSDLVFLAVIFVAVYIRRIPDYGFPLGFPAFMMFFFASFVGASPAALPMLLLAIAIGLVCAGLIRIVVLPPRSARTFRRVRRGFQARLAQVLDSVADLLADGATPSRLDRLRRRVDRMHESALMVEAELDTPLAPDDAALHQRRVLGAELAAESLAHEARRAMTAADRPGDADRAVARDRLATLIELIRIDRQRGGSGEFRVPDWVCDREQRTAGAGPAARGLLWAIAEVGAAVTRTANHRPVVGPPVDDDEDVPERTDRGPAAPPVRGLVGRMLPSTRQAVQATVGCGLAILAGELLSPQRWYWAVIAAFVVFAGTTSAGQTLMKGFRRVVGTLVGIVTGTVVALLVAGDLPLVVGLLFVCIFAGFYLVAISYSAMTFFITVMLGLLYSLLGTFTPGLLVLRLEETAAGAAAGALAALVVLPTSTKSLLRDSVDGLLERLAGFVTSTVGLLADGELVDLIDASRDVDADLDAVQTSAEPLLHRISPRRARRSDTRHLVRVLTRCAHHARGIAANAEVAALPADRTLAAVGGRVAANLRRLRAVLRDEPHPEPLARDETPAAAIGRDAPAGLDERTRRAVNHLTQLDQAVLALARPLGARIADGSH
ncbi:FUSC family protein [Actinocatenispora thailandica]|uniref:FUSC family protein n=1 Tax=Actinocatenispora thailandica TaxID=227318 RepID=UPI0031DD5432